MEEPEVRKARTESLFRDVNEHIAVSARRFESKDAEFVCECSDPSCTHRVPASLDAYEHVRSEGVRFLLAPGHADDRIEQVVERRRRYDVVEKVQRGVAELARRLDPRIKPA